MNGAVIGLDTSNYRTSLAAVTLEGEILLNERTLLPVEKGERGLRQADAVYAHLKQIKPLMERLYSRTGQYRKAAVCASTRPRERAESYMPVFEAGDAIGRSMAAALGVPFFATDHQSGHIRAAQYGTPLESETHFLALHLSGGTTDLLLKREGHLEALGSSLDLHAGQLVDRIGVELGLSFPAGPEMEQLAQKGVSGGRLGCVMRDRDLSCHLSGAEAQARRWIAEKSVSPENIAREIFDLLVRTVCRMLTAGESITGEHSALLCGGISSSGLFREMLAERLKKQRSGLCVHFGRAELSGDNAFGVALLGADRVRTSLSGGS